MAADENSLLALTRLLAEFYSASIKPERRHSIQNALLNFEQSPTAWYSALYYLCSTSDKYVALYCLGVIEKVIVRRWTLLSDDCKLELRRVLHFYLMSNASNRDYHLLDRKVAKVLASIACFDWPHSYPDFLEFVKHLSMPPFETENDILRVTVGLSTLQSTFEEFLQPSECITFQRRKELRALLIENALTLYSTLHSVGVHICGSENILAMAADCIMCPSLPSQLDSPSSNTWSTIFHLTEHFIMDQNTGSGLSCQLAQVWLECLCELFKILPLDTTLQHHLYGILYILSLLGSPAFLSACNLSVGRTESMPFSSPYSFARLSITALMVIQEIIERKDLTSYTMSQHLLYIFPIIQCHLGLINGSISLPCSSSDLKNNSFSRPSDSGDLSSIVSANSELMVSLNEHRLKLTDLLKCLMTNFFAHMIDMTTTTNLYSHPKLDGYEAFDATRFLRLVHDFTFSPLELDTYCACLNVWTTYFDFLDLRYKVVDTSKIKTGYSPQLLPDSLYSPVVLFGQTLTNRLYLSESVGYLETLEDDTSNESYYWSIPVDMENSTANRRKSIFLPTSIDVLQKAEEPCEYRVFIRESLLVLYGAVTLAPGDLLKVVVKRYWRTYDDYLNTIHSSGLLSVPAEALKLPDCQPLHRMHWAIRDYATSLQIVGFMLNHIYFYRDNNNHQDHHMSGPQLLQSLLSTIQTGLQLMPFITNNRDATVSVLCIDLLELIVQSLLTTQAIIQGGHVICESASLDKVVLSSQSTITLSAPQCESFCSELTHCLNQLIITTDGVSIPTALRVRGAQLLECLVKSSFILGCNNEFSIGNRLISSVSSNDTMKTELSLTLESTLLSMFRLFCDTSQRDRLPVSIQWIVVRILFYCLGSYSLPTNGAEPSQKLSYLLDHCISLIFTPGLSLDLVTVQDVDRYLLHLGLLTEGIEGLHTASGTVRHNVYNALLRTGLIDGLVTSMDRAVAATTDNENGCAFTNSTTKTCLCAAYLTFFTTFTNILSHTDSKMASVPKLLARIIHALYSVTQVGENSLTNSLIDGLIDLFQVVCKNRRVLLPITGELLELCIYRFLPTLALESPIEFSKSSNENGILTNLVLKAGLHNGPSMERFYELLFTILLNGFSYFFVKKSITTTTSVGGSHQNLSSMFVPVAERYRLEHADDFHRLMQVASSVLYANQENSTLVRLVLDKLFLMHRMCNFYELPAFNQTWLPTIAKLLMDRLIQKQHHSCHEEIIDSLYQLFLNGKPPHTYSGTENINCISSSQLFTFVSFFLDAYLDNLGTWLMQLTDSQREILVADFFSQPCRTLEPSTMSVCPTDSPGDISFLKAALERFTTDVRCLHATQMVNTSEVFGVPSFVIE